MRTHLNRSFAIIGAGILGAAVAREITNTYPNADVTILDKSERAADHQTGHNSGVVHAGLYYQPGSLKARLCRRGVELMHEYANDKDVPFEECGKIVVALESDEEPRLKEIFEKSVANGVPDVELVGPSVIRDIEPNAVGRMALHSPHTAIIDYAALTRALIEDVKSAGGTVKFASQVVGVNNGDDDCSLTYIHEGIRETQTFTSVISCAGLQSDRIARLAGGKKYPKIVPFFGQYSQLSSDYRDILNGLVYPVPDPAYPFLGVHLTKRVDGEMLVGPNAFLSFGRENYDGWKINIKDSLDVGTSAGFWKFASKNSTAAVHELGAVISRKKFLAQAAKYVPSLEGARSTPIPRGIRAQAIGKQGELLDDFAIENIGKAVLIRNAPSPGATSALAIAEYVVKEHIQAR